MRYDSLVTFLFTAKILLQRIGQEYTCFLGMTDSHLVQEILLVVPLSSIYCHLQINMALISTCLQQVRYFIVAVLDVYATRSWRYDDVDCQYTGDLPVGWEMHLIIRYDSIWLGRPRFPPPLVVIKWLFVLDQQVQDFLQHCLVPSKVGVGPLKASARPAKQPCIWPSQSFGLLNCCKA